MRFLVPNSSAILREGTCYRIVFMHPFFPTQLHPLQHQNIVHRDTVACCATVTWIGLWGVNRVSRVAANINVRQLTETHSVRCFDKGRLLLWDCWTCLMSRTGRRHGKTLYWVLKQMESGFGSLSVSVRTGSASEIIWIYQISVKIWSSRNDNVKQTSRWHQWLWWDVWDRKFPFPY